MVSVSHITVTSSISGLHPCDHLDVQEGLTRLFVKNLAPVLMPGRFSECLLLLNETIKSTGKVKQIDYPVMLDIWGGLLFQDRTGSFRIYLLAIP